MTRETTYAGMLGDWQRLLDAVQAEDGDLQFLTPQRTRLNAVLDEALEIAQQQATFRGEQQLRTQRLQTLIGDGQRMATTLRSELRNHYGRESGKLSQFNVRVFRGRARRREETNPSPPQEDAGAIQN